MRSRDLASKLGADRRRRRPAVRAEAALERVGAARRPARREAGGWCRF